MRRLRFLAPVVLAAMIANGCAHSMRSPALLARGEIATTMEPNLVLRAGGEVVGRSPVFRELPAFVDCAPLARAHAHVAFAHGRRARVLSILGATLGASALVGFAALADRERVYTYLGAAVGSGTMGLVLAGMGRARKRDAIGHALDAVNEYNDAVGSLGATCADLRYAAPSGPRSPLPYPALPPPAITP